MEHILTFALFESRSGLTAEQEEFLNGCTKGSWTLNPATGLVDVDGTFDCSAQDLKDFKGIRFGKVSGDFTCNNNPLTSLAGSPQEVGGRFICNNTLIENLEGLPQKVGSGIYSLTHNKLTSLKGLPDKAKAVLCRNNRLTSLEGSPREIEFNFQCQSNYLKNLIGAPQKVGFWFVCSKQNEGLTSLEGAPREVGGGFDCSQNNLTSLAGAPREVGMNYKSPSPGIPNDFFGKAENVKMISFDCGTNNLTSLAGAPQKVGGNFYCKNNSLTSLAGSPEEIRGEFYCDEFKLGTGKWNLAGWLSKFTEEKGKLLSSMISPEVINKEIQKNPSGMVMALKGVWNDPDFKQIKDQIVIPDRLKPEMELLGDLGSLGF